MNAGQTLEKVRGVPGVHQNGRRGLNLAVQWLRLCAFNAGAVGSIPGRRTKIPHTTQPKS